MAGIRVVPLPGPVCGDYRPERRCTIRPFLLYELYRRNQGRRDALKAIETEPQC
ncbi:hypothetical protein KCP70_07810 [Salmonella enterica subsp. enterica]|nr:hypothetical protein KCP70_07810 [Salmonella enterica subsp. enterica]